MVDGEGRVILNFKETKHTYRSWTSAEGMGHATPLPLEESDMKFWEPDPTC